MTRTLVREVHLRGLPEDEQVCRILSSATGLREVETNPTGTCPLTFWLGKVRFQMGTKGKGCFNGMRCRIMAEDCGSENEAELFCNRKLLTAMCFPSGEVI
jgi:hypothetical protein